MPESRAFHLNWEKIWRALPYPKFLSVQGSISIKLVADSPIETEYTAGNETVILADATKGLVRIRALKCSTISGRLYKIKNIGLTGKVIFDPFKEELVEKRNELELDPGVAVEVYCDQAEWWILAKGDVFVKMEDLLGQMLDKQDETNSVLKDVETHLSLGSGEELNKEEAE